MMKTAFLLLAPMWPGWMVSAANLPATNQAPPIQNTGGRETMAFDGQRRAIVHPYQSGYPDYRYRPCADGGFGANKKATSAGELVEYDIDGSGQLAVPGRHGSAGGRWTEEFQADVYRRQVAMFQRMPFLSGKIARVLVDFRSPRRTLAGIQNYFNRKGRFSDRGESEVAFNGLCDYDRSLAADAAQSDAAEWKLVWHDEFDGEKLDPAKWDYVKGGNGFGNQELEYYTDRPQNLSVRDGMLVILALKEDYHGAHGVTREFTSARIQTRGKFARAYGKFEARIKIPYGQGIWPAFWMMGEVAAEWPAKGEIDVMENIGREPSTVHGTAHGPGYSGANGIEAAFSLPEGQRFCDDFHVFAVEWEPGAIRWYVDGKQYHEVTPASLPAGAKWVYDHPFYLLLNLAVGGGWPGSPDSTSKFPQKMLVDYVRVFER